MSSPRLPVGLLVRILAGGALLALVISRVDPAALTLRWDARTALGVAATVALGFLAQLLSAARWRLVLGGDAAPPFGYLFRIYLVGFFFSLFLPTSVGGDAVRAVSVSRASRRPAWAVSSVVFERMLGLAAMFALLFGGALVAPAVFRRAVDGVGVAWSPTPAQGAITVAVLALLGLMAARLLRRSERVRSVAADAAAVWTGLAARPRSLAAAVGVSLGVQATYAAAWLVLAFALRLPVPALGFLVLVPLVSIAAMLPLTVSGIGLREGAWVLLLAPYGVAAADAVAFSLLYFASMLAVGAAGGALFALRGIGVEARTPVAAPRGMPMGA
jgi:hypothetical protein